MASLIYGSFLKKLNEGDITPDSDTFKVMLLTSSYTGDADTHDFRNDLTNEFSGTGYTAGGAAATVTVGTYDTTNNRVDVTLGGATWSAATITARYAAYYKSRGGASSADELVALIDFGSDISSTAADFTLTNSTLRFTNSNG